MISIDERNAMILSDKIHADLIILEALHEKVGFTKYHYEFPKLSARLEEQKRKYKELMSLRIAEKLKGL